LKALSAGVGFGIGIVDSVYFGGLEEGIGPDLAGAKGGGGIGGKEGVACASGEDDHTTFFQMAEGSASDKGFGHIIHFDRGHHSGFDAGMFEGILQGEGVNYGGEHAHVVGGITIHATFAAGRGTSPDIAATNDDGQLEGGRKDIADLMSEPASDDRGEMIPRFG
jgi:hypothetical protein